MTWLQIKTRATFNWICPFGFSQDVGIGLMFVLPDSFSHGPTLQRHPIQPVYPHGSDQWGITCLIKVIVGPACIRHNPGVIVVMAQESVANLSQRHFLCFQDVLRGWGWMAGMIGCSPGTWSKRHWWGTSLTLRVRIQPGRNLGPPYQPWMGLRAQEEGSEPFRGWGQMYFWPRWHFLTKHRKSS